MHKLQKLTLACATALYMLPLSAMDEPMEIEGKPQHTSTPLPSLKRKAENDVEGHVSKQQKLTYEMDVSNPLVLVFSTPEIFSYIMNFCGDEGTENALLSVNKYFVNVREGQYKKLNEKYNHLQWHGNTLSEHALFHFNMAFNKAFGIGINLLLPDMAHDIDRTRFERVCAKIKESQFFKEDALPKLFTEYLMNVINYKLNAAAFDQTLEGIINQKFAVIEMQQDPKKYQNETALYFCYRMFNANRALATLDIWTHPLLNQCTGSLMVHLNQRLWDLKKTEGLDGASQFAETWDEIISLDPGIIVLQLDAAAFSHFDAGNFAKAAEYYEKQIDVPKAARQPVPAHFYDNAAYAHSCAENLVAAAKHNDHKIDAQKAAGQLVPAYDYKVAADSHAEAENFDVAAAYYGQYIEMMRAESERVSANDYKNAAVSHYNVGNFAKAAEYYEKCIEALNALGQVVSANDYGWTATVHFKAGNFAKAAAYYDQYIEEMVAAWDAISADVYNNTAFSHFRVGEFADAAAYYDQYIEMMRAEWEHVPAYVYEIAARSHYNVGNFAKAAAYYEEEIKALNIVDPMQVYAYGSAALSYAKLGGHDEKVIEYGELWFKNRDGAYSKAELEFLQYITDAYKRKGDPERVAFFGDILKKNQG